MIEFDSEHTGTKENDLNITEYNGFWREYGYGMVAFYNFDFKIAGGFDLELQGWGLEDIHLAQNILKRKINIIRSNEPDLVHIYHDKHCPIDMKRQQQLNCLNESDI